jgi:polyhydroxybutyrate depolymerase
MAPEMHNSPTPRRTRTLAILGILALAGFALYTLRYRFVRTKHVQVSAVSGESAILPKRVDVWPRERLSGRSEQLVVRGQTRSYELFVPHGDDPTAHSLVFVVHGDGGDGSGFHRAFPFEKASGDTAILVYPDGEGATWDLETALSDNKDYQFFRTMADRLAARFGIEPTRIFGAGYSSGGFLLNMMACGDPSLFAGISSSAAGPPYQGKEKHPNGYAKCPGQRPVPMIALHGTQDFAVPIAGGAFSAAYWAYVNGCDPEHGESTGYPECYAFRGCPSKSPVAYCEVPGVQHWVWEKAQEASWTFFSSLPLH